MRKALLILAVAILAVSCSQYPEDFREYPEVPVLPPPPPERVLRKPPDFTFRDHGRKQQFFIRVYSSPEFEEEFVTVVDLDEPNEEGERLATLDEHDYAMSVFEEDWLKRGMEDRLRYHIDLRRREERRRATLLDEMIRLTRAALEDMRKWKFDVDADLAARKETGAFQDAAEIEFRRKESERLAFEIGIKEARLRILEYKAWLRDRQEARSSTRVIQEIIDVGDILSRYPVPSDLVAEITANVQHDSWSGAGRKLEIQDHFLVVRNTSYVIGEVRAYLTTLSARQK